MTQKGQKISRIDEGLSRLEDLTVQQPAAVTSLCLHGNSLRDLQGLRAFCSLETLNLSSNCLTTDCVEHEILHLLHLADLDLASNRLSSLGIIPKLASVKRLNLAHNFLSNLDAFRLAHTSQNAVQVSAPASASSPNEAQRSTVEELDLCDNILQSLHDLRPLQSLSKLKRLHLQGGSPGNELCMQPGYRLAVASLLPQLELLDGCDLVIERLQLARDPKAAMPYLLQAAETSRLQHSSSGIPPASGLLKLPHDHPSAASPEQSWDSVHQMQLPGSWTSLAAPDRHQASASALIQQKMAFQQARVDQPLAAPASSGIDSRIPVSDPSSWNAAWTRMQSHSSQAANHLPLAAFPSQPQTPGIGQHAGLNPSISFPPWQGGDIAQLQSWLHMNRHCLLPDGRLPANDSAADARGLKDSNGHDPLLSSMDAYHQVSSVSMEQGNASSQQAANGISHSSPVQPTTASPAEHARGSQDGTVPKSQRQPSAAARNGDCGDAQVPHEQQRSGSRAKAAARAEDAACQAGDSGIAIDRLQQDADR